MRTEELLCMHRDPLEIMRSERFQLEEERYFFIPSLGLIGPHVSGIAVR